ncbi:MAG: phosphoribosylglycinamide formyltransferase [Nitrospiraceae bacterium]|nr:MAG: phosphoribosylglycinamide formyltransferase [Nitrospiraceae bacterium]
MPDAPLRLAVLASGRGSNLQAIIDAIEQKRLRVVLALVISNKAEAQALERARKHGVPAVFLDPKATPGREAYDAVILEHLRKHDVGLVALAGYMKIVTRVLIDAYANRIMNIHPSLLPSFPGLAAQQQALDWGVKVSGCTVHFVEEGVDTGPIIRQAAVLVTEGDTAESLEARILVEEHRIYPEAIQLFAEGRLMVEGRRVHIR